MSTVEAQDRDRPVEEPPRQRGTLDLWAVLLVGPVLWALHFGSVYLFAEAACVARDGSLPVPGSSSPVAVITVVTVAFAAAAAGGTAWSWRAARGARAVDLHTVDRAVLGRAGALLGGICLLAILAVGLSALAVPTC